MARFKFRLEKVLEVRRRKEEEKEKELASLKKELRREEEFLEKLRKETSLIAERIGAFQKVDDESLNLEELRREYDYLEVLRNKITRHLNTVEKLMIKIEEKRKELIEASKERKIMEKLKDKQYRKFRSEEERKERKVLDEIGTLNYNHKRVL